MTAAPAPLPAAVQRMLDATNAEESEAFLSCFAEDAMVDDWGRQFIGRAPIAEWNAAENIGTHNRIIVTGVSSSGDGVLLDIQVSGEGDNGGGTFAMTVRDS